MAVVAQSNDGADHWLRGVLSGRPLDGSVMQTAASFGAITLRDGSAKAKVQLLPFDGDEYGVFAFVDAALLLNEAHCSERLSLIQRLGSARGPWQAACRQPAEIDGHDRPGAGEQAPRGSEARHQRGDGALPARRD